MDQPDYNKAKNTALELLSNYSVREPVVPVAEIAQREGVKITYFRPDEDENLKKVSGFYEAQSKTIFVNADDAPARQQFTIAHELGHYKLGHNPNDVGVLYRFSTPIDKNPVEQEANCFAANLLVPEELLEDVMKRYQLDEHSTSLLADMFGVSSEVIKYRLLWTQT